MDSLRCYTEVLFLNLNVQIVSTFYSVSRNSGEKGIRKKITETFQDFLLLIILIVQIENLNPEYHKHIKS